MNTGIPEPQLNQIKMLFAQNKKVNEVILFGSRAKGKQREGSDIDLALKGSQLTSSDLTKIEMAYEKLYLPWKLDLIIYESITNQELKEHVDRVGILIFP